MRECKTALKASRKWEIEQQRIIDYRNAVGLLSEVVRDHRDKNSCFYNECDTDPCAFCNEANEIIGRYPHLCD